MKILKGDLLKLALTIGMVAFGCMALGNPQPWTVTASVLMLTALGGYIIGMGDGREIARERVLNTIDHARTPFDTVLPEDMRKKATEQVNTDPDALRRFLIASAVGERLYLRGLIDKV